MAVIKNRPGQPFYPRTFDNPSISGVAFQIRWNELEPTEGSPDWSRVDTFLSNATTAHKWVQLCVSAGFFTPAWALAGVKSDQFTIPYGPDAGRIAALPMPWDTVYLQRWLAFVKVLSARYAASATVRMVAVAGPTSVSEENTLPNSPTELKQWQADGYAPSNYLAAWKRVLTAYAADFPNQYLSIAGVGGLSINNSGKIDPTEHARTLQALAVEAKVIVGDRLALQYNNLDGTTKPDAQGGMVFISGYIGKVITGYQLRTSAAGPGMGAPNEAPPDKLRQAIDKGLRPSRDGQHVDFVQIYEADVLAAEMQPVLRYGASLFAPKMP